MMPLSGLLNALVSSPLIKERATIEKGVSRGEESPFCFIDKVEKVCY